MGSVEVYDYQQQKWVPYVGDPEEWYQHFKDLRDGYVQPDHRGRYIVGSGSKYRKQQQPTVNLVTPVAQANAIAQSEVEREKQRKKAETQKRKNVKAQVPKPKRQKTKYDSDDIFSI